MSAESQLTLSFERFSSFLEEYAPFLSLGGLFVRTPEPRTVGSVVGIEFLLSDGFCLIRGEGEVVWVRLRDGGPSRPAGMGLRLQALDEQGRELILKVLEEQVKSGGEPFDVDEIPADASTSEAAGFSTEGLSDERFPPATPERRPGLPVRSVDEPEAASADAPETSAIETAGIETPSVEMSPEASIGPDVEPLEAKPSGVDQPVAPEGVNGVGLRELDFNAPWDEELPALPIEILEDSEPSEPESTKPAEEPPARSRPDSDDADETLSQGAVPEPDFTLDAADTVPGPPTVARRSAPSPQPAAQVPAPESTTGDADRGTTLASLGATAEPGAGTVQPQRPVQPTRPSRAAIVDYEHDLFHGESGRRGLLGGLRDVLAGRRGIQLVLALALSVAVAGGFYFRERLSPLFGLAPQPASERRLEPPSRSTPADSDRATRLEEAEAAADLKPSEADPVPASSAAVPEPAGQASAPADGSPVRRPAPGQNAKRPEPRGAGGLEPAAKIETITWRRAGGGTVVTIDLDGRLAEDRVVHDRLSWATDREQLKITGIVEPVTPSELMVGTPDLLELRSGLHAAATGSELRLVFDFGARASEIAEIRYSEDRLEILVRARRAR